MYNSELAFFGHRFMAVTRPPLSSSFLSFRNLFTPGKRYGTRVQGRRSARDRNKRQIKREKREEMGRANAEVSSLV